MRETIYLATMNRLADETSPYLLQHAANPVDWRPWGPEALDEAKRADKPILLSIGYAACHWCHVMAHESFENEAIAKLMNEMFVPIKVDREERPDLDTIYQHALAMLGEQGGWPLTMFLTPEGEPFWGGTYFPPEPRFGRPAFTEVLRGIHGVYRTQRDKVTKNVAAIRDALDRMWESHAGESIPIAVNDQAGLRLAQEVDRVHGGIGSAPKFPNHLGGGFARYSTDAEWLVPHFEKMLYDNAQLLDLLRLAWQDTRSGLYERRIRETVDWTLREMIAEGGGFAATLDADSEHEEGKFYVWSEAEVDAILGADAPLFKSAYDVTAQGNWEHKNILRRTGAAADEAKLAPLRAKLLAERAKRVRPGWDDKVLADWNGMMIAAMARAGRTFGEPAWVDAARSAFDFVASKMTRDGRLLHSYRRGEPRHAATLDDYAAMMLGAVALYEVEGDARTLDRAKAWLDVVESHFRDPRGGYFFTADDAEALIVRTKTANDQATPSGNGMLAQALVRLYYLTGDESYRVRCEALIAAFAGEVERNFFPLATLLNASEMLQRAVQIVVAGPPAAAKPLADVAWRAPQPDKIIQSVAPGATLPANHPAFAKASAGEPAAYVCVGTTCSLPLTAPDALEQHLRS
jgi:uncharacterized protein YyaL (SSP411 family)